MYIDQKVYKAQSINIKGKLFHFDEPKIMGIINLSHDSFYENDSGSSAKDILANKKIEMKMKKDMMAEAEKKRIAAIKETIKAESDRDTALQEQYLAEQDYKEAREDLITWEKNQNGNQYL